MEMVYYSLCIKVNCKSATFCNWDLCLKNKRYILSVLPSNLLFPTHLSTLLPSLLYRPFCPTAFSFLHTFLPSYLLFPTYLPFCPLTFSTLLIFLPSYLLFLTHFSTLKPSLPYKTFSFLPTFLLFYFILLAYLSNLKPFLPYLLFYSSTLSFLPSTLLGKGGGAKIFYDKSFLHALSSLNLYSIFNPGMDGIVNVLQDVLRGSNSSDKDLGEEVFDHDEFFHQQVGFILMQWIIKPVDYKDDR